MNVVARIAKDSPNPVSQADIKRSLHSDDRDLLDDALKVLEEDAVIESVAGPRGGPK